jgi:hypothetical protein
MHLLALTAVDVLWAILVGLGAAVGSLARAIWKLSSRVTRLEALDENHRHPRSEEP